jgi:Winged helix DNA-binding domain
LTAPRRIDAAERRARLTRRHRLAPTHRADDVVQAAASMVCLHATDPGTIYLSAWARVDGMTVADMERALYDERTLVKHLAMRRTLFVFPRATLPIAQAAAADRVAASERRKIVKDVEAAGLYEDGGRWLDEAGEQVVAALAGGRQATSTELRAELPLLQGSTTYAPHKSWGGEAPVGPRVLTALSAAGRIVRAVNTGGWTIARHRWTTMDSWLGHALDPPQHDEALAALVTEWLRAFGPGTETDLKWWVGTTLTAVRKALADVGAVEVDLDGRTGYLLPDDLEPADPPEPWAALLPPLDPTTMGWFERDFYLGPYKPQLFDSTGNGGPTVWWDGRIVGGWRQGGGGEVELQLLEDVGADGDAAIEREAARLTDWLGGTKVLPRFPSPLSKQLA